MRPGAGHSNWAGRASSARSPSRPLLPILALGVYHGGEADLGVMNATIAVGAVLGTLALLKASDVKRKGGLIILAYAMYALGLAASARGPGGWAHPRDAARHRSTAAYGPVVA